MISATEYYLAKALNNRMQKLKQYISENNINSLDDEKTIRLSLEKQDIVNGYIARIQSILLLFKTPVLREEELLNILKLKKSLALLMNKKQYNPEIIIEKIALIEKCNNGIEKEIDKIIYKSTIVKESSRFVSFVCPTDLIKDYLRVVGRAKYLLLDGKEIKIRNEASSENCKIYCLDKKEYMETYEISEDNLKNRSQLKDLKEIYYNKYRMLFAPTKLGLAPIFEYDVIKGDKDAFNKYLVTYVMKNKMERLKYYDVLELLKNNFVPNRIISKQVVAHKAGIVYSNGWYNSSLVDKESLTRLIESDLKWDQPGEIEKYNALWNQAYRSGLKKRK